MDVLLAPVAEPEEMVAALVEDELRSVVAHPRLTRIREDLFGAPDRSFVRIDPAKLARLVRADPSEVQPVVGCEEAGTVAAPCFRQDGDGAIEE
jgi:hypothetical protein